MGNQSLNDKGLTRTTATITINNGDNSILSPSVGQSVHSVFCAFGATHLNSDNLWSWISFPLKNTSLAPSTTTPSHFRNKTCLSQCGVIIYSHCTPHVYIPFSHCMMFGLNFDLSYTLTFPAVLGDFHSCKDNTRWYYPGPVNHSLRPVCYFIWLLIPTFINRVFCSSGPPSATAWMYLGDLPVLKTFPTTSQTLNMYVTVQIAKCAARHLD